MPHSPRSSGLPILASWRCDLEAVGALDVADEVVARDAHRE
jgi:hypothetical protein